MATIKINQVTTHQQPASVINSYILYENGAYTGYVDYVYSKDSYCCIYSFDVNIVNQAAIIQFSYTPLTPDTILMRSRVLMIGIGSLMIIFAISCAYNIYNLIIA